MISHNRSCTYEMEVSEVCRLCLTLNEDSTDVSQSSSIISKIRECVSVEINSSDRYTKNVCAVCLDKVERWHVFKIMCLNSKRILEAEEAEIHVDALPGKKHCLNQEETKDSQLIDNNFVDAHVSAGERTAHNHTRKGDIYSCNLCNETFECYTDYLDHQANHNREVLFSCDKCHLTFQSRELFAVHKKKHKIRDKIPCNICGTVLQRQSMKLHLNKHTDKYKCSDCGASFTGAQLLKVHISSKHLKVKSHFCECCGKGFGTKSSLKLHLKTHNEDKTYKCGQCDFSGKTSISLRIHMSTHEKGTYMCEYCSKIYKSTKNLRDHLTRVHTRRKNHVCDVCNKKFILRATYEDTHGSATVYLSNLRKILYKVRWADRTLTQSCSK